MRRGTLQLSLDLTIEQMKQANLCAACRVVPLFTKDFYRNGMFCVFESERSAAKPAVVIMNVCIIAVVLMEQFSVHIDLIFTAVIV